MSEEIIKILDALAEKFGIAIDWTSENVIPYLLQLCNKYVNYEITTSIVWIMLGLLLIVAGFICFKIIYDNKNWGITYYNSTSDNSTRVLTYLGIIIIFIISIIIIINQIFDIITCFTFPEKMFFRELKSMYFS